MNIKSECCNEEVIFLNNRYGFAQATCKICFKPIVKTIIIQNNDKTIKKNSIKIIDNCYCLIVRRLLQSDNTLKIWYIQHYKTRQNMIY